MDKQQEHYSKVKKILTSCENRDHLVTAVKIVNRYIKQYDVSEDDHHSTHLEKLLSLMKAKCGVKPKLQDEPIEEDSSVGKEFKVQSGLSGVPQLQKLKFEDEMKGGLADDTTTFDFDPDQLRKGIKIELEHTNDKVIAKEIAMDHLSEDPKYYDHLTKMEDSLEDEEIEESTSAGSSGSYTGLFSSGEEDTIRQTSYKSDVPVSTNGVDTPIGKLHSFKKSQLKESNVFTKKDILDETIGSIATYDSPAGWGNNKFMGTKGKKGNAVQRKGNDHKKTYDYDTGSSTFVKIKDKCKKFPYCNQSPEAIELSKTPFNEQDELIENICKKTGKSKKYVHSLINRYL